jgi:hypothetical protein
MNMASGDRCPRCGGTFACGMGRPGPCPCTTVTLEPELLADLRRQFSGCLCLACLRELGAPEATKEAP